MPLTLPRSLFRKRQRSLSPPTTTIAPRETSILAKLSKRAPWANSGMAANWRPRESQSGEDIVLFLRRGLPGFVCGLFGGTLLVGGFGNLSLGLAVGAILGTAYTFALPHSIGREGAAADRAMTAAAFGLPMWGAINVILLPLFTGQTPQWTAEGMRTLFPALVGWLLFGFALGLLATGAVHLAERLFGAITPVAPARKIPEVKTHIVILGGGF